ADETGPRYRQRGAVTGGAGPVAAVSPAGGNAGLKLGQRRQRLGGDLGAAGLPSVDRGEGDAEPPGELLLAQPKTTAQVAKPLANRILTAGSGHPQSVRSFRRFGRW